MTDVSAVETDPEQALANAVRWAGELCKAIKRQLGCKEREAISTAAQRAQVDEHEIWKLRYRPGKEPSVSVYNRLKVAHERYVKSPEATIAENLALLRTLPQSTKTARLVASLEEFLGGEEGQEARPASERAEELGAAGERLTMRRGV